MANIVVRITSTSLLLAVFILAASASTCLCGISAAAPDDDFVGTTRARHRMTFSSSSRFLEKMTVARRKIAGGGTCRAHDAGACAGQFMSCCGGVCTDVLTSWSNCGMCGKRCPFGRVCCDGRCVAVAYDVKNCGVCGRACDTGMPCTYGMCGYA